MWASTLLSPYLHPKLSSLYSKLCKSPCQCGLRIGLYTLSSRWGVRMGCLITKGVSKQCMARLHVTIRLDYYGTYDYCFYETSLLNMTSWCYVAMLHTTVIFCMQSFNSLLLQDCQPMYAQRGDIEVTLNKSFPQNTILVDL